MSRSFFSYFFFVFVVVLVILFLRFMNWIPMMIQNQTMRSYTNIHEIRTKLNIREIYVPSYYPQQLSWPPSEILAQNKPFPAIVMEFRDGETGETILFITQVAGEAHRVSDKSIKITQVKEQVEYSLKGRAAELVVGQCMKGESCSRITWEEGEYHMRVAMRSTPFDLIKIAESMLRETADDGVIK